MQTGGDGSNSVMHRAQIMASAIRIMMYGALILVMGIFLLIYMRGLAGAARVIVPAALCTIGAGMALFGIRKIRKAKRG